MQTRIRNIIENSIAVKQELLADNALLGQIERLAVACLQSLHEGGKIIFAGNGGSFADSQHLSAEFTSRFQINRSPLPSLALGTNSSTISAVANDYGYEQVFARELESIAGINDVFIPISTSGNSPNILAAAIVANKRGINSMGLAGRDGGKLTSYCECICVPSGDTARIQESHIMIGHIVCGLVESMYFHTKS